MPGTEKKYFLPLGEDCQLGAALNFYGYKESSLLKWAKISSDKLRNAFLDDFREIYDEQFADVFFRPTKGKKGIIGNRNIELPRNGGWGAYDDYMKILDQFHPAQIFNTAVIDKERGFTHGIQVSYSELKILRKQDIKEKNQEKITYLKKKTLHALNNTEQNLILIRAQRKLNPGIIRNLNQVFDTVSSMRPPDSFKFYIITLAQNYHQLSCSFTGGMMLRVFKILSPPSNPMLLQYCYPEWKKLFFSLGVPVQSKDRKLKYFSGFEDTEA